MYILLFERVIEKYFEIVFDLWIRPRFKTDLTQNKKK